MSRSPEHAKLSSRRVEHGAVCDFVRFLTQEKGLTIGEWVDDPKRSHSDTFQNRYDLAGLIAEFFDVDPKKFEAEKVAMLEELNG